MSFVSPSSRRCADASLRDARGRAAFSPRPTRRHRRRRRWRCRSRRRQHTLLRLPLRELLLLGVLDNRGFLFIVAAYGVLWESGLQGRLWDQVTATFSAPGLLSSMWGGLMKGQLPSLGLLVIMAGGLLALVAVVRVLSMVWVSVTLHDFRLMRAGNDLRTEYGLLTRVTSTIPRGRIQSLTVRETPLQRWCGRASIRVRTAGGAAGPEQVSKRPRELLAPIVRASAVPEFIRQVLPQADMADLEWQPLHPRAARRAIKPLLVLIVVSAAWSVRDRRLALLAGGPRVSGDRHRDRRAHYAEASAAHGVGVRRARHRLTRWLAVAERHPGASDEDSDRDRDGVAVRSPNARWRVCASTPPAGATPGLPCAFRTSRATPPWRLRPPCRPRRHRRRSAGRELQCPMPNAAVTADFSMARRAQAGLLRPVRTSCPGTAASVRSTSRPARRRYPRSPVSGREPAHSCPQPRSRARRQS